MLQKCNALTSNTSRKQMGAEIFRSRRAKIVYGEAENDFSYDNAQSSKSVTSRNKLD